MMLKEEDKFRKELTCWQQSYEERETAQNLQNSLNWCQGNGEIKSVIAKLFQTSKKSKVTIADSFNWLNRLLESLMAAKSNIPKLLISKSKKTDRSEKKVWAQL